MAVRIRLTRLGRKRRPFFRIVAVDSRRRRDGEYLEKIGHYDPIAQPPVVVIDEEKAIEWLKKGAKPSDTVRSLFSKQGIMMKFDLIRKGASDEKIADELKKYELLKKVREEEAKKSKAESAEAEDTPKSEEVHEEGKVTEPAEQTKTETSEAKIAKRVQEKSQEKADEPDSGEKDKETGEKTE